MIIITDAVLDAIDRDLLAFPPERGGALLGAPNMPVVSGFIYDSYAATTAASYVPSVWLTEQVREHEKVSGNELKGVIHTHPDGIDHPSGPDRRAVASGLHANPHLSHYLCPIGTRVQADEPLAENELRLAGGKLSFYMGRRRRARGVDLVQAAVRTLPIGRDSQRVADHLAATSVHDLGVVELEGRQFFGRQIVLSESLDLTLLHGLDYPISPPIAFIGHGDGQTTQLSLQWPLDCPPQERLLTALRQHFHPAPSHSAGGAYRRAWGPSANLPLTEDAETAAQAKWPMVITNIDVATHVSALRDDSLARTRGLLPKAVSEKRMLIAGAGSVGSYASEQFVRSGISRLDLLDPDIVEWANLSRTAYRAADVGLEKVHAQARILLNIDPCARITRRAVSIQDLGVNGLDEAVKAVDLVFNAADDPLAARALARFAYARGKPFVSVGLFAGALGGEVIISVPGRTPCFHCMTGFRRTMEREAGQVSRATDYGTGRLQGEVALGVDVQHVASAGVKLALSLMMPADAGGSLRDLAEGALNAKTPYLLMGMSGNYWFFPTLFMHTPGQHAYQSVWAQVDGDPDCPVCGSHRLDPLSIPLKSPTTAAFRQALDQLSASPDGAVVTPVEPDHQQQEA